MQDVKETLINYIRDNQDKLYRMAFSYAKNEDAALDIVQEAITKALKNIDKLKEEKYVNTWFYRIVINECLQYIKKNKKMMYCRLQEIENKVDWKDSITYEGIDTYKCVQKLSPKIKTVILLRFFEDKKIEEIAKITNTNVNTVKSRLYKGLKELRKWLKNE